MKITPLRANLVIEQHEYDPVMEMMQAFICDTQADEASQS